MNCSPSQEAAMNVDGENEIDEVAGCSLPS
jgi:hypothetical protein